MRDIPGYEGLYAITSCGKVWSYRKRKFLKQQITPDGYYYVNFNVNKKSKKYKVHRLVAKVYIPNPDNLDTVDHIDGNKAHNYINNLQWLSNEDNVKKTHSKKVLCIETNIVYSSTREAERQSGVNHSSIGRVCNGKQKTAGNYHWKYV